MGKGVAVGSSIIDAIKTHLRPDEAQLAKPPGGIDLKRTKDAIEIDKQDGGVQIQFDPAQLESIRLNGVEGFVPVIINIVPIQSILPILGLEPKREEELQVSKG